MEKFLKFLFPPKCIFCEKQGDVFCDVCLSEATLLQTQYCLVCDRPSSDGVTHQACQKFYKGAVPTRLLCVYAYTGKVRDCIKFSKYGARQFLSLKKLSEEAVSICEEMWGELKADVCLPIPSGPRKLAYRGFNQANMIAESVSKKFGVVMRKDILIRFRDTDPQHTQKREQRRINIMRAFRISAPDLVRGKRILLVDDISTTGATFLEAAETLYEAGAAEVQCFALSKREKFCYNSRA